MSNDDDDYDNDNKDDYTTKTMTMAMVVAGWLVTAFSVTNKWKSQNQMCTFDGCCVCVCAFALAMNPATMSMVKSADIYIGLQITFYQSKVLLAERRFLSSSFSMCNVCECVYIIL